MSISQSGKNIKSKHPFLAKREEEQTLQAEEPLIMEETAETRYGHQMPKTTIYTKLITLHPFCHDALRQRQVADKSDHQEIK